MTNMISVQIIDRAGAEHLLRGRVGYTLMELALEADIAGIDADCRGSCACATCHVHVADGWTSRVGPPNELEGELLTLAEDVRPTSRLSCQIRLTAELDGLDVRVAF